MSLTSLALIQAILHVNVESRQIALRHYKLTFADQSEEYYKFARDKGPRIYFDSSEDTLYQTLPEQIQ